MVHRAANILTLRDKAQHGIRRRILSQGFSENALRGFEPAILAQIEKFSNKISPSRDKDNDEKWSVVWNMARECKSSLLCIPHQKLFCVLATDRNMQATILHLT